MDYQIFAVQRYKINTNAVSFYEYDNNGIFCFLAARHLGFKAVLFPLSAAIFFTPVGHSKGFPLQSGLTTSFRFLRSSEVSKFQSSKVSSFTRELRNSGTQALCNFVTPKHIKNPINSINFPA